jgi:hypothetical protein
MIFISTFCVTTAGSVQLSSRFWLPQEIHTTLFYSVSLATKENSIIRDLYLIPSHRRGDPKLVDIPEIPRSDGKLSKASNSMVLVVDDKTMIMQGFLNYEFRTPFTEGKVPIQGEAEG